MIVERTDNEIVVRLPSNIDLSELQDMLDFLKHKELTANSKAKQEDVYQISKEINSSMWEKVKKTTGILIPYRVHLSVMEKIDKKYAPTFEDHLEKRYGAPGTDQRIAFEGKAKAFAIGELIKEERKFSNMTQEQLALKTGTKKSFISRIENVKSDIQLSTLYKIFEIGLGKKISFTIE